MHFCISAAAAVAAAAIAMAPTNSAIEFAIK
jgi:hypothetical protein